MARAGCKMDDYIAVLDADRDDLPMCAICDNRASVAMLRHWIEGADRIMMYCLVHCPGLNKDDKARIKRIREVRRGWPRRVVR